jgi:hypothetical protein
VFVARSAWSGARVPIWPGRCGAFWTTYEGNGASIDVSVTLYATSHDVRAALAEPALGPVRVLPNGARVRTREPVAGSANNTPSSETVVVSAFRNLFITTVSELTAPVPIAAQLRIHQRIYAAAHSLG